MSDRTTSPAPEQAEAELADVAAEEAAQAEEQPDAAAEADQPAAPETPNTATVEEYQALLGKWSRLVGGIAEQNYQLAAVATEAVATYLATLPGKAQRSTAVYELAVRRMEADDDSLYPPRGKTPDGWRKECLKRHQEAVQRLLHVGAVCRLLYGSSMENPLPCADGESRAKGTKAAPALSWRRVRELAPLVERVNAGDECSECWLILPGVADEAYQLALDLAAGLKQADVVQRVRQTCLLSAQRRLESPALTPEERLAAEGDVSYWGGKVAPQSTTVPPTSAPAAAPAPAPAGTATVSPVAPAAPAADEDAERDAAADEDADEEPAAGTERRAPDGHLLRPPSTKPVDLAEHLLVEITHNADALGVLWELGSLLAKRPGAAAMLTAILDGATAGMPPSKARSAMGVAVQALSSNRGPSPVEVAGASAQLPNGQPAAV